MKIRIALGVAFAFAILLSAFARGTSAPHPDRVAFDVQISPMAGAKPGEARQYMATAVVRELETGKEIFASRIHLIEGKKAISAGHFDDVICEATFLIHGPTANYVLESTRKGEKILSYSGIVNLGR